MTDGKAKFRFLRIEKYLISNYFFFACLAVLTWEYGHPYVPGLVVDHDHGSEVTDCHTH